MKIVSMRSDIVPKTPYMIVRNGTCYFDMRVPPDVVGAYRSKFKLKTGAAIRFSLRTKDRKRAQRLVARHLDHYEELFAELRRSASPEHILDDKVRRGDLSKLSRAELELLVTGYYRDVLKPAAVSPPIDSEDRAELVDEWDDTLARVKDRRDEDGNGRVQNTTEHILPKAGWPSTRTKVRDIEPSPPGTEDDGEVITRHLPTVNVDRAAEQYRDLMDLVRRASIEASRLALAELRGAKFTPSDALFLGEFKLAEANDKLGPLLSEALVSWKAGSGVQGGRKPRPQTVIKAEMAVRHFTQLNGDMRIGEIGKKLVQGYAASISAIPVKLTAELQKLTLPDLLKRDLSKFRRRSVATVNKSLQMISAMIEQARRRSDLDEASHWPNHFKAERVESDATAEDDRVPFSAADLKRIFVDGPVHGQGKRFQGGQGEAQ